MPSCPRCGVENPRDKAACWSCFAPMSARPDQFREVAVERAAEAQAPARPLKKVLLGVVVVAVLGAAGWYFFSKPSPAAIGKKYLEAVKAGDAKLQAQYATLAAMSREEGGVGLLKMLSGRGVMPTTFTAESIAVGSELSRDLVATLTFEKPQASAIADLPLAWREPLRGGGTFSVQLKLVSEGRTWKVDDIVPGVAAEPTPVSPAPTPGAPAVTDEEAPTEGYVGNMLTKTYHLPTCPRAPTGKTAKRFATKEEAEDAGFRPCSICIP